MDQPRTRQQVWEEEYRANPYLAGKPEAHLIERFRYLMENHTTLTDTGQLGFENEPRLIRWLLAKLTHTMVEFGSRGGLPAGMLAAARLPTTTYPAIPRGTLAYRQRKRPEPGQAFKFGKFRWLEAILKTGSIRFAPASCYRDASLNQAIRDDELTFTYFPARSASPLQKLPHPAGADWVQMRHPSNYYVQCLTNRFAVGMFDSFEADSCLLIYDAKAFGQRVLSALRAVRPGWIVGAIPLTYIDPDDPGDQPIVIPGVKHMKFVYQQEERLVCHPPQPITTLEPIMVEAGPLTDIAEIVRIP